MRRLPVHTVVVAIAFVAANFIEAGVHPAATGRAFLVAAAGAGLLQLLGTALFRDRHRGSALATGVVALVIFWFPLVFFVEALGRIPAWVSALVVVVAIGAAFLIVRIAGRVVRGRHRSFVTEALNVVAVCLLVVVVLSGIIGPQQLSPTAAGSSRAGANATSPVDAASMPDIYVVILDGNPRGDALTEQTGDDQLQFESDLAELGFQVSSEARSAYDWSRASVAAFLGLAPLDEAPAGRLNLESVAAFDVVYDFGYETVAVGPPYEHVALRQADRFIDAGYLNDFECHLIRRTAVGALTWAISPRIVGDARRDGVHASLSALEDLAASGGDRPRFVIAHLPVPHLPILWTADGAPADDAFGSDCAPLGSSGRSRDALVEAYLGSLAYTHEIVTATLNDMIAAADEPPVILVISDHGAKMHLVETSDAAVWRDTFGILFAAYAPGQSNLFPADTNLVNALPRAFNAYLGTSLPLSADMSFWGDGSLAEAPRHR